MYQDIKDYLKNHNENVNNVLNNLLSWMKKGGVVNIALSSDKLVVEFSGKREKVIGESELNSEQKVLKNYLQSSADKKSISRSELEKMVGGSYNEEGGEGKPNSGNTGIIVAIVAVGIIFVGIISIVVYKSRKRDY